MRKIVFHYHLFKNAGTSVDLLLKKNFGRLWVSNEFSSNDYPTNLSQVSSWLQQAQYAQAFSSHTALLPAPQMDGIEIFPIIFIRHPIDRIASAYAFERTQNADTAGSIIARNTSFNGYINAHLNQPSYSQCRNFHLSKLKNLFADKTGNPADLAIDAVTNLPFVGLVEQYDESIKRLITWLKPHFPYITAVTESRNITRDISIPLEQKLHQIHQQIGDDCYSRLLAANRDDLALYNAIKNTYPN